MSPPVHKKEPRANLTEKPLHKIHLGALKLIQKDENHNLLWSLSSKESEVIYRENGTLYGHLKNVEGQFYKLDKPINSFKALLIEIDQQKQKLIMKKNVEIYSFEHKVKLYADTISYLATENKIFAEGNVKIEGEYFFSGPFSSIRASLDLKDIGTPNNF